jgi:hypothetical protein
MHVQSGRTAQRQPGAPRAAGGLDEAVGAFVRLLQDAPPLQRAEGGPPGGRLLLSDGLERLAAIRARLPAL